MTSSSMNKKISFNQVTKTSQNKIALMLRNPGMFDLKKDNSTDSVNVHKLSYVSLKSGLRS